MKVSRTVIVVENISLFGVGVKIVFVAGPYIGDGSYQTIEKNIREAEKYQIALANQQIGFFCSHNHTEHFSHKGANAPEEFYYQLDLHFLKNIADAVLVVPGWESSFGTKREIATAKEIGLPIFYPKSPQDIDEIIKWSKDK